MVTGEFLDSSIITIAFAILATVVFYANDRAWNKVLWGKVGLGNFDVGVTSRFDMFKASESSHSSVHEE